MLTDYPCATTLPLSDRLRLLADAHPTHWLDYHSLQEAADLIETIEQIVGQVSPAAIPTKEASAHSRIQ